MVAQNTGLLSTEVAPFEVPNNNQALGLKVQKYGIEELNSNCVTTKYWCIDDFCSDIKNRRYAKFMAYIAMIARYIQPVLGRCWAVFAHIIDNRHHSS